MPRQATFALSANGTWGTCAADARAPGGNWQDVPVLPDLLSALDAATDQFRRHVSVVGKDQWAAATPCTGWDVHYLVAHVVGGNRFAALVLAGRTADDGT